MAEIHVAKNALSILDEIIELAEQVEANNNFYRELGPAMDSLEITRFQQDFDRLKNAIDLLGFKWCEIDPLTYCFIPTGTSGSFSQLHFMKEKEHTGEPDEIEAPKEVKEIVEKYFDRKIPVAGNEFPAKVRQVLSLLREKLKARSNLYLDSNTDKPTEIDDTQSIITPKLINGGRTIECGKGTFNFTVQQAQVIAVMWDKRLKSQEYYSEQIILEDAGIGGTTFANIFKSRIEEFKAVCEQHEAMKDCWRLNLG